MLVKLASLRAQVMFRKPRTFRIQPTSGERGHVILIRVHKSMFQVRCTRIHRHMCTLGQATLDAFISHLHYRQDVVWRHRVDLPLSTTATAAGADDSALVRIIVCSDMHDSAVQNRHLIGTMPSANATHQ